MTIVITILFISAVAAIWTVYPLLSARTDQSSYEGRAADGRVAAWNEEKDRLVGDMVALDIAFAEKRISEADYKIQRSIVMTEAEKAADRLGSLRTSGDAPIPTSRSYPQLAMAVVIGVLIGGSVLAIFLNSNDLRTDKNPHADGRVPLPDQLAGSKPGTPLATGQPNSGSGLPMHADGTPDVGAMVARLEARVKGSDASVDDIIMLARSYRVLEREADSLAQYRRAQAMAPEDEALKLVLASALIRSENEKSRMEGEELVDAILKADPKKPEAMWLKSLGLIHRHEIGQAREILSQLSPLVAQNADANNAVSELLSSLETAASSPPASGNSGASKTPPSGSEPK